MNNNWAPNNFTFGLEDFIILLANIVLGGRERVTSIYDARKVLNIVFDGRKISLIKFVRSHSGLGLREAKDFAENYIIEELQEDKVTRAACAVRDAGTFHYVK